MEIARKIQESPNVVVVVAFTDSLTGNPITYKEIDDFLVINVEIEASMESLSDNAKQILTEIVDSHNDTAAIKRLLAKLLIELSIV